MFCHMYLCAGPLVGLSTKYVKLRTLSLLGSLILCTSTIGCCFANDMTAVFILLGLCTGVGTGIVLPTNDVVIGQYFSRYRGSGSGIYYTGGTLAAFAFPPLLQMLIQEYGLRGSFLITGGLSLNALAGSLLYSRPPWIRPRRSKVLPVSDETLRPPNGGIQGDGDLSGAKVCLPSDAAVPTRSGRETSWNDAVRDVIKVSEASLGLLVEDDRNNATSGDNGILEPSTRSTVNGKQKFLEGDPDSVTQVTENRKPSKSASHFSFLKDYIFYLVALTCIFSVYATLIFMVLVDYAEEKGFTRRDGAVLLSLSAIGDASARLLSGVISDRSFVDRRTMMGASCFLLGVSSVALPSVHSYAAVLSICVLFGWACGTTVVLIGPILADHLGVEHLGVSMGICRFAMGAAFLGCPKITGYFKDEVGSYNGLMLMIGSSCFLVSIMWIVEALVVRLKRRRSRALARTLAAGVTS